MALEARCDGLAYLGDWSEIRKVASSAIGIADEHDCTWWRAGMPNWLALAEAQLGNTEQAYQWMQESLDAGYWDFRALMADEDFSAIIEERRFRKMMRTAWTGQYLSMLEREEREEFQHPDQVMEALGFKPGEKVADIGTGSGCRSRASFSSPSNVRTRRKPLLGSRSHGDLGLMSPAL